MRPQRAVMFIIHEIEVKLNTKTLFCNPQFSTCSPKKSSIYNKYLKVNHKLTLTLFINIQIYLYIWLVVLDIRVTHISK